MTDTTVIETEDLKAIFDLAVGSMNFGSGFLDGDEVAMLRRIAVVIGVDPWVATPRDFKHQFPHEFVMIGWNSVYCRECNRAVDHPSHKVEE